MIVIKVGSKLVAYSEWDDLAGRRVKAGMDEQERYRHDAYFERPTGRRHALPDNETVDNFLYSRGRR